jgi:hypothetical protein
MTELDRSVRVPCVNPSFVSFAHKLFVCNRRLGSGNADLEGDPDFIGDAEDRLTGLFVGEGGLRSIIYSYLPLAFMLVRGRVVFGFWADWQMKILFVPEILGGSRYAFDPALQAIKDRP